jgi:hypothetical protein
MKTNRLFHSVLSILIGVLIFTSFSCEGKPIDGGSSGGIVATKGSSGGKLAKNRVMPLIPDAATITQMIFDDYQGGISLDTTDTIQEIEFDYITTTFPYKYEGKSKFRTWRGVEEYKIVALYDGSMVLYSLEPNLRDCVLYLAEDSPYYNPGLGVPVELPLIKLAESYYIPIKLTNSMKQYLEELTGESTIAQNLYIPVGGYVRNLEALNGLFELDDNVYDASAVIRKLGVSFSAGNNTEMGENRNKHSFRIGGGVSNSLTIDSFSDADFAAIYPKNAKDLDQRFAEDIVYTRLIMDLISKTVRLHEHLATLGTRVREQQFQRMLDIPVHKGNKELFAAIFPELARKKDVPYKAFIVSID